MIEEILFFFAYLLVDISYSIRRGGAWLLWKRERMIEKKMSKMTESEIELYLIRLSGKKKCSPK